MERRFRDIVACCVCRSLLRPSVETHVVVTNVMDFGAFADGVTDDGSAIQSAVDYVSANGGGDVVVPYDPDGYFFKSIDLKSNVHLLIDGGTTLQLNGNPGGSFFLPERTQPFLFLVPLYSNPILFTTDLLSTRFA